MNRATLLGVTQGGRTAMHRAHTAGQTGSTPVPANTITSARKRSSPIACASMSTHALLAMLCRCRTDNPVRSRILREPTGVDGSHRGSVGTEPRISRVQMRLAPPTMTRQNARPSCLDRDGGLRGLKRSRTRCTDRSARSTTPFGTASCDRRELSSLVCVPWVHYTIAATNFDLAAGNSNGACGVVRPAAVAPVATVNSEARGHRERARILS